MRRDDGRGDRLLNGELCCSLCGDQSRFKSWKHGEQNCAQCCLVCPRTAVPLPFFALGGGVSTTVDNGAGPLDTARSTFLGTRATEPGSCVVMQDRTSGTRPNTIGALGRRREGNLADLHLSPLLKTAAMSYCIHEEQRHRLLTHRIT